MLNLPPHSAIELARTLREADIGAPAGPTRGPADAGPLTGREPRLRRAVRALVAPARRSLPHAAPPLAGPASTPPRMPS